MISGSNVQYPQKLKTEMNDRRGKETRVVWWQMINHLICLIKPFYVNLRLTSKRSFSNVIKFEMSDDFANVSDLFAINKIWREKIRKRYVVVATNDSIR